ncbi:MAG: hypothetical protein ACR2PG_10405 [Hyphomicrobiaceae bacterium]
MTPPVTGRRQSSSQNAMNMPTTGLEPAGGIEPKLYYAAPQYWIVPISHFRLTKDGYETQLNRPFELLSPWHGVLPDKIVLDHFGFRTARFDEHSPFDVIVTYAKWNSQRSSLRPGHMRFKVEFTASESPFLPLHSERLKFEFSSGQPKDRVEGNSQRISKPCADLLRRILPNRDTFWVTFYSDMFSVEMGPN